MVSHDTAAASVAVRCREDTRRYLFSCTYIFVSSISLALLGVAWCVLVGLGLSFLRSARTVIQRQIFVPYETT